jgi:ribosomal protein S18 acetylase RimI-like enzyme
MKIEIRRATPADADAISNAHVRAWQVAYRGIIDDEVLDSPAFATARHDGWERALNGYRPPDHDPDEVILVPVLNGRVVGFGNVGSETPGAVDPDIAAPGGELYGFYLHPDAWGSGVGQALIEACTSLLRDRFTHASLFVLRDNPRARRFYERNGWQYVPDTEYMWPGPTMPGTPALRQPVAEVQHRIHFN